MATVATIAVAAFAGFATATPAFASAAAPPSQGCGAAHAKGGPRTCDDNGAGPVRGREAQCYRGGAIGMIPGVVTGNPAGIAGGAIAGCIGAATAPSGE